jgi:hypothetical protein
MYLEGNRKLRNAVSLFTIIYPDIFSVGTIFTQGNSFGIINDIIYEKKMNQ